MVDLVYPAPQKIGLVTEAVPPVVKEGECDVTQYGAADGAEAVGRPRTVSHHPAVPGNAGDVDHADLAGVEEHRTQPPAGDARPRSAWIGKFTSEHDDADGDDNQGDDHEWPS